MRRGIFTVGTAAVALMAFPPGALGYTSRRASGAEVAAIVHDARRTAPCGYDGRGRLSAFRVVSYTAHGMSFKWAQTDWTLPGANGCVLVFLHVRGDRFVSNGTPHQATVDWLPFTWGSSPFENPSALTREWRQLHVQAGPPRWSALARAL